ncbi:MAG TPA: tyrosine-type recombinase/integrase [Candidatus Acidoferrales bacterium]|jgi:integrase|nr:tyrosine-type recombinase/integrase [Candidatus Acidoferrales bacterium]
MREQRGSLWHKGPSWFLRYSDDVMVKGVGIVRKNICTKLEVPYGGEYKTKKSVRKFAKKILDPLNEGKLDVRSTMLVTEFVETAYLIGHVQKLRASTQKGYKDMYRDHIKARMGQLTLRSFRTVDGEQMLSAIARQTKLGRNTLKHLKSFLSGVFKEAKRLGVLDGLNPMQDTSLPVVAEPDATYAYSFAEIKAMVAKLPEPARTVVLTAGLTGLRKSELRGLTWGDYDGKELCVNHSVWNSHVSEPKTHSSKAPVPVIRQLAEALDAHRKRAGKLAQDHLPIFQSGNGSPLHLDNVARRVIQPAIEKCIRCRKPEAEHKPEGCIFELDQTLAWHGWHAFRRGIATNLHGLGVADTTIQRILRHSDVEVTRRIYIKPVKKLQTDAMEILSQNVGNFETCNATATPATGLVN